MQVTVTRNENVFKDYYLLEVRGKGLGGRVSPGQFFMIKVGYGTDPLLRRPISLHKIVSKDTVRLLYKEVGRGTGLMSRMVPGDTMDVVGPLGNGFSVPGHTTHAMLVAGGIGVAPLLGLAERLRHEHPSMSVAAFIGGRSGDDVLGTAEFRRFGIKTYISTEDGSLPRKGRITDSLEEYITKYAKHGTKGWTIYTCGPKPMMMGVAAIASMHGIKCYASLESRMACGVGACVGCVTSIVDREHGGSTYKLVCKDGPVFDTEEVVW